MRRYVGTEDLIGAVVVEVGWNEVKLSRDGRTFVLLVEEEWDSCFCDGPCTCSPSTYLSAREDVAEGR